MNARSEASAAPILDRLHERRLAGKPVWAGAAHDAASAGALEKSGVDFLIFHPDYLPVQNALLGGLRPLGNANEKMRAAVGGVLSAVSIPLFAGVCGSDPFLLDASFLLELKNRGTAGVHNFPTLGLLDGLFRANLEESGIGFEREIGLLSGARAAGLAAAPVVFTADEAKAAAPHADILILHPSEAVSVPGKRGPRSRREAISVLAETAKAANTGAILLILVEIPESVEETSLVWNGNENLDGFLFAAPAERAPAFMRALSQAARR